MRRALGDDLVGRIPPHLTLVPPINVRIEDVDSALTLMRNAAASVQPFALELGPVSTFAPTTPVIKLDVAGDGVSTLSKLRDAIFVSPLKRELTWPFDPHVTLSDDAATERIDAAVSALDSYRAVVTFDRVYLLREGEGRVWRPIADAGFETVAIVGRGGIEVELSTTRMIDPITAMNLLDGSVPSVDLVVTGRRDGIVVGVAAGVMRGDDVQILRVVVDPRHRLMGIGTHILRSFMDAT